MKKICENCKWWKQSSIQPEFGDCLKMRSFGLEIDNTNVVNIRDIDDCYVGKNFGCIHWKERE